MNAMRGRGWRSVLVGAAGFLVTACAGKEAGSPIDSTQGTPKSPAKGAMSLVPLPPFKTNYHARCGTKDTSNPRCSGELKVSSNWSGSDTQMPFPLSPDDAKAFKLIYNTFKAGNLAPEDRLGANGDHLLVNLESIKDGHLVAVNQLDAPVVLARLTVDQSSDPGAVDSRYGVKVGATYFFVVKPTGDPAVKSAWWAIVGYVPSTGIATIIKRGTNFHPCLDADGNEHQQKRFPFAWFLSCEASINLTFESITQAKSATGLDSVSKTAILDKVPQDFRIALKHLLDGDEPIWINCGLGCCTTEQ